MGYNTTVIVLNDAVDQIAKDPQFGKKLADAISSIRTDQYLTEQAGKKYYGTDVSAGNHCNAATVIETHHADITKVILVGGNMGEDIGAAWLRKADEPKELQLARALAEEHGYHLRKNPERK